MVNGKSKTKRLVLIDGHALIHRAYHALPPMHSSSGQQTNAVYGFVSILLRVIADLKPSYIIACFDLPAPTFRQAEYIAYQAHRPETEQAMRDQIGLVKETVRAADIPIYTMEGFEADDVIGTLAKQATKGSKYEVIIITGDRDIMQLVNDLRRIKVYAPVKGLSESRLFNTKEVKEYMGVAPQKIIDYKALVGDQSDNYPGVPGIGPKTAITLLEKYKDLDGIYKALGTRYWTLGERVAKKLEEGKESAFLSQKLATIVTNVPIKLDLKKARLTDLSKNDKFIAKLGEFGFRSLVKRLTGGPESPRAQSIGSKKKKDNGQMGLL